MTRWQIRHDSSIKLKIKRKFWSEIERNDSADRKVYENKAPSLEVSSLWLVRPIDSKVPVPF